MNTPLAQGLSSWVGDININVSTLGHFEILQGPGCPGSDSEQNVCWSNKVEVTQFDSGLGGEARQTDYH